MEKGDQVNVYTGKYAGYYGQVMQLKAGKVRVSHRPDDEEFMGLKSFEGFFIDPTELEQPLPPVVEEKETND